MFLSGWVDSRRGGIKNQEKDWKHYQDAHLQDIFKHSFFCVEHSAMWKERILKQNNSF